jgi:hypothetical protein
MTKALKTPHSAFATALQNAATGHEQRISAATPLWTAAMVEQALTRPADRATIYRGADMALRQAADNSIRLLIEDRQNAIAAFSVAVGTPGVLQAPVENHAQLVDRFLAIPEHECGGYTKFSGLFDRRYFDLVFDHEAETEGMAAQIANGMRSLIELAKGVKFETGTPTNIASLERGLLQNIGSALRLIARSRNIAGDVRAEAGDLVEKLRARGS